MATPIGDTPVLYGDEAVEFLNGLDKALTEKEKKIIKEINSQRFVPF